jgi:hypothetical protein
MSEFGRHLHRGGGSDLVYPPTNTDYELVRWQLNLQVFPEERFLVETYVEIAG